MTQKKIKNHFYDRCDGGICLNCDRCTYPDCCTQTEDCEGHNWDFLDRTPEEWMKYAKANNFSRNGQRDIVLDVPSGEQG